MFLPRFIGHALIRYNNLGSAVYAKEKLNGFEYPPGNRLVVSFFDDGEDRSRCQTHSTTLFFFIWLVSGHSQSRCRTKITFVKWSWSSCKRWFFKPSGHWVGYCRLCCSSVGRMAMQFVATQMMSTVWNSPSSSQVLKPSVRNFTAASLHLSPAARELLWRLLLAVLPQAFSAAPPAPRIQTDVSLPSLKKLAPPDSKSRERLFIVFNPAPLPQDVLEDVFW